MKVNVMKSVKKLAAVATGALFLGATMGVAAVFGSGLSGFGTGALGYVHNGAVNAVVVVGASAQAQDILGAIDVASALTAAAAATHSGTGGFVTIGTLSLVASARTSALLNENTSFSAAWHPGNSASLSKVNFTGPAGAKVANYTAVENVTFSSTVHPFTNGLNVVFPVGSYWLSSFVVNRSHSNAVVPLDTAAGLALTYSIGTTQYSLLSANGTYFTVGTQTKFTNVKVPQVLTVGTNTLDLEGIATFTLPTSQRYELEFTVNGGSTQYVNFSSSTTADGVTVTPGASAVTNTTGTFLSSLSVSSVSLKQYWNVSRANVFGLGAYNVTVPATNFINFSNAMPQHLNYSFSATNSFELPSSLSAVDLEPLTHAYSGGSATRLTVNVGAAATDTLTPPDVGAVSSSPFSLIYTHGLTNVQFGIDYRGNLPSSGSTPWNPGAPDGSLEHFQWYTNDSNFANVTAKSEYIFPAPTRPMIWTNASATEFQYAPTINSSTPRVLYELPNGQKFALVYSSVTFAGANTENVSDLLVNFSGSTFAVVPHPAFKTYRLGGFNLTLSPTTVYNRSNVVNATTKVTAVTLKGPTASVDNYNLVPGYSTLYAPNGTGFSTVNLGTTVGKLSFSGSVLTYTDPLGGTQTVGIAENTSSFGTSVSNPTNTTANTWGDLVNGSTNAGATLWIPTQNYTLALGGSQAIASRTNYSVGQTVGAGEVLNIGGVSAVSAPSLFSTGVFPLATLDSAFSASTNSVPVVVVGGPAVNTVAQALLGQTGPVYGAAFTNLTGVSANEALVQLFTNSSAVNKQNAVLIAGYSAADTLAASEVVSEYLLGTPITQTNGTPLNLNGNKMILSTGASGYTGEGIVSES